MGRLFTGPRWGYLAFFPALMFSGFPALEFDVAKTLGFSFFGFFASLLPRLLSPFDIDFSLFEVQRARSV